MGSACLPTTRACSCCLFFPPFPPAACVGCSRRWGSAAHQLTHCGVSLLCLLALRSQSAQRCSTVTVGAAAGGNAAGENGNNGRRARANETGLGWGALKCFMAAAAAVVLCLACCRGGMETLQGSALNLAPVSDANADDQLLLEQASAALAKAVSR